ncbi:DUF3445 domain-containing protein [Halioxenophilus sp. WMMB6]|uniref:heme-dependent oxidative N-demethylase family protein n=1 Tax=Halioxenophilus sp. WMMB6 TaxID=3073815 RepID=UPI00295E24FF|nr:DUF3445 domain-containing protein [Halioxenophilus sp. WMMB6]
MNSAAAVARFPFPFEQKKSVPFRYSVNIEPHATNGIAGSVNEFYFDIDEFYLSELAERERVLAKNLHHFILAESAEPAAWELLAQVTRQLAADFPNYFFLSVEDDVWHWQNKLTQNQNNFIFGDAVSLGMSPLLFVARTVPGDWVLLEQKKENLFIEGGVVTGPAGWSLAETFGMDFLEWHAPVPDDYQVFPRSLKYLLRMPAAQPVRRKNWGLCVYPRLDMSMEAYAEWRNDRDSLAECDFGDKLNLRVEHQVLERLPESGFIFFHIRTYFLTLNELVANRQWRQLLAQVLATTPEPIIAYKGLAGLRPKIIDWLAQH